MPLPALTDLHDLAAAGARVGRAVVSQVWGSAPRGEGACMLATEGGRLAGSVSGGCVENAVAAEIAAAIARGTAKQVTFGVSDEAAWEVGLSCGGTIKVFVEPAVSAAVSEAASGPGGVVVATVVDGVAVPGAVLVVRDDGTRGAPVAPPGATAAEAAEALAILGALADRVETAARAVLAHNTSRTESFAGPAGAPVTVLLELFPRRPTLVIFGGVHVAQPLVTLARALGYRTVVADGRAAWVTRERFPDADELLVAWPEEAFAAIGLDAATCVCLLSHDPKFDEPAMRLALRSPAAYVGAIGSRKTQAKRRERLRAEGFSEAELARLRGPIGLDLGGREPRETALAILAEITAARFGGSGRPLTAGEAP